MLSLTRLLEVETDSLVEETPTSGSILMRYAKDIMYHIAFPTPVVD